MPTAFVVIKDGNVRIMSIDDHPSNTVDRLIDSAPEIIDKIYGMVKKDQA